MFCLSYSSLLFIVVQSLSPVQLFATPWTAAGQASLSITISNSQLENISFSVLSLYDPTLTSVHDYWKNHSFDCVDLCWQSDVSAFNTLSRFGIAFLPRSKCLLISWLSSPSAVILEPREIKSATVVLFTMNEYVLKQKDLAFLFHSQAWQVLNGNYCFFIFIIYKESLTVLL